MKQSQKTELKAMRKTSETSGTMLNVPTFESSESRRRRPKERPCENTSDNI